MSCVYLYSFEDADDEVFGTFSTFKPTEAEEYARKYHLRVVEHEYEWADSYPVEGWDFTSQEEEETDAEEPQAESAR